MIYIVVFILLFVAELLYFRIATRYNIVDKPNHRSSHTKVTIRGGGVIYWVAALLYLVFAYSDRALTFFIGITLIAVVSFVDDVMGVRPRLRLLFHLLAMTFAFFIANMFVPNTWWIIIIAYVMFVGIVNAYNFMDGINGITGLYSIAALAALQYVNLKLFSFVQPNAIWFPIIASVVFLFFNFRKRARCFAGDVGSISVAFWIVTLMLMLIVRTQNLIWIGFLAVYGVDAVMTILHRIYLKQNLLEAHRLHFYQILVNERMMPHLVVSSLYFVVQLICSALIIYFFPLIGWWILTIVLILLMGVYSMKFRLMRKEKLIVYS